MDAVRRKKVIVGVVAAAAVVLLAVFALGGAGSAEAVYVQSVADVNLASGGGASNRYAGVVESQDTQQAAFDSSRTLGELLVAEGDHVEKGDALFTYDTEATKLQVEQGELEIEQKNTTIANDEEQIASLQGSMASATSAADRLSYSAQIQELEAEVAQATYDVKTKQAEVDRLKAVVADPSVKAEISGVVSHVGDVSALSGGSSGDDGSDSGSDEAFVTIVADGDFRVKASVSEQTISQLAKGAAVVVRSRVDANETWGGAITSIETSPEATTDAYSGSDTGSSASTYAFYVSLDSTDGLMLGQHVTVELDFGRGEARSGIWLDGGWIETDDDGSTYVWAASTAGGRLERRGVTLGDRDEDLDAYQVTAGLQTTDYLAWPDDWLVEGAATTVAPATDASETDDLDFGEDVVEDKGDDAYVEDEGI